MPRHRRTGPAQRMLIQRDPRMWTVSCRDGEGRPARLDMHLTENGVKLTTSSTGPWRLTALDAGRLRGAVRRALLDTEASGDPPAR